MIFDDNLGFAFDALVFLVFFLSFFFLARRKKWAGLLALATACTRVGGFSHDCSGKSRQWTSIFYKIMLLTTDKQASCSARIETNLGYDGNLARIMSIGWRARRVPTRGSGKTTLQNHDYWEGLRKQELGDTSPLYAIGGIQIRNIGLMNVVTLSRDVCPPRETSYGGNVTLAGNLILIVTSFPVA